MSLSQNDSGRALEYGVAISFSRLLPATITDNSAIRKAEECFKSANNYEKENIVSAAHEIVLFLIAHDKRLADTGCTILVQSDKQGQIGDVRDVVITNNITKEEIGISVKHRHNAVKHSRLSEQIDFGTDWMNIKCSEVYFDNITSLFQELRNRKIFGEKWRDITDKKQKYYIPILKAFQKEMEQLFLTNPVNTAKALVQYLLGRHDFYKVIKQNGSISATSFNINGTLKWGKKMPMPTKIIAIEMKPNSQTTLFMTFDKGWQLSFRIHNASTLVEPSLKFDINIVGMPFALSNHDLKYHT